MISARTKAALAAAKARGVALGGWNGGPKVDGRLGASANKRAADELATRVGPMTSELREQGRSLRQIAAELTEHGIRTARGGQWTAAAVRNVLERRG
jgi:DNA invertase Pin-like site-specific DNA recombinase